MKQKRVTIIHCQRCRKEVAVGSRGRVPSFCVECAPAGRKAKSRTSKKCDPQVVLEKASRKARRQQFSNDRFARKNTEGVLICQYGAEMLGTRKVVELPTSEGRWHIHPIHHPPVTLSQPSICGYWGGTLHDPNFKHRTAAEIAHWENILAMPSALYWPKGQTTQLSVLLDQEDKTSLVDGIDDDDVWQNQSVVESLDEDGRESVLQDYVEELTAEDQPSLDGDQSEIDGGTSLADISDEEISYGVATSLQVRLALWWMSRHKGEEPLNLRLFSNGRRSDALYGWIAAGGSRLDFSHTGRKVSSPVGPRLEDGLFYTIGDVRPLHTFEGRWCSCSDCVASRTPLARLVDRMMGDVYGRIKHGTELLRHGTEIRYISNWVCMKCGDEFRFMKLNEVLGEKVWQQGGLEPTAKTVAARDVERDLYSFNRVTPLDKTAVISSKPELRR